MKEGLVQGKVLSALQIFVRSCCRYRSRSIKETAYMRFLMIELRQYKTVPEKEVVKRALFVHL